MRIERIEEMRLGAEDDAEIGRLLDRAFGAGFDGRSFHMQRHHLRLVARDSGIVGHMALCLRAVRLGERLVDIVGLAEVASDPARRGQGIASRLMEAALEEARATGASFFVLFGDRPLYAGTGFEAFDNPMRWVEMDGARTGAVREGRTEGLMVLPLGPERWDGAATLDLLGHMF